MGGRRPHHRLPRQKLCLMVSSDPKLVSGTQGAIYDRAGFRTRDAPLPSPATLTLSPARPTPYRARRLAPGVKRWPGHPPEVPRDLPLLKALGRWRSRPQPPSL